MPIEIMQLTQFSDPLPLNEWKCSMMMCPSQCYYHAQKDGIDYVLYLRWRWDDPWQAHIIKNAQSERIGDCAEWSGDLFEQNNISFTHEQFEQAKEKLIAMFLSGLPTLRQRGRKPRGSRRGWL